MSKLLHPKDILETALSRWNKGIILKNLFLALLQHLAKLWYIAVLKGMQTEGNMGDGEQ